MDDDKPFRNKEKLKKADVKHFLIGGGQESNVPVTTSLEYKGAACKQIQMMDLSKVEIYATLIYVLVSV